MGGDLSKPSSFSWYEDEPELECGQMNCRIDDSGAKSSTAFPTLLGPWMGDSCAKSRSAFPTSRKTNVPDDTLLIFDWDDTLLCSSALNFGEWTPGQLLQLERAVESVLNTALKLGETMIVTNGNESWVQDSTREFVPGLSEILKRVPVISARATYERLHPGDPITWKRLAFRDLLSQRRQRGCDLNLVVIGDSPAEIEAARSVKRDGTISRVSLVKTVKFKIGPTVNELLGQLRRCEQELEMLVQAEVSTSRWLVQRLLPVPAAAQLDRFSSWPSRWRLEDTDETCGYPMRV